jgi:1-deoxy-D-xylulose-5-phosphate reductoisomerase
MPRRSRRFDPVAVGDLTFEAVREEAFPAFALGLRAGMAGESFPAVYNAANEVAVAAFLAHRLGFAGIGGAIADALDRWSGDRVTEVEDVLRADRWAREATRTYIEQHALC